MQSGRILPAVRLFFGTTAKAGSANKDGGSQGGQSQQRSPERDASEEEGLRALELLRSDEEFKKNGLTAECAQKDGKNVIFVRNALGAVVRMIKSHEIVHLLLSWGAPESGRQGRILDRRI